MTTGRYRATVGTISLRGVGLGVGAWAIAASVAAVSAATGGSHVIASACHTPQLRFLRTVPQPINGPFVGYPLSIRNVSQRACVLPHFLSARVPLDSPASVAIEPSVSSTLLRRPDLEHPLVVQPETDVITYLISTAVCFGARTRYVDARVVIGARTEPTRVTTILTIRACRNVAVYLDVPPLTRP